MLTDVRVVTKQSIFFTCLTCKYMYTCMLILIGMYSYFLKNSLKMQQFPSNIFDFIHLSIG